MRRLGAAVTGSVARLGFCARFLVAVLWHSPQAFRRIHLTLREIYFAGVLSLVIILMSGMFVGMVLALQGYQTLRRYGSDEQLGILVALALVRELAPVI
ncbi:MAG TPA: ABC transporter permease, partial [Casimicrobiaceae bacterium]|nr:ABC transporter permease [Casimicrobiaceae bacterium]